MGLFCKTGSAQVVHPIELALVVSNETFSSPDTFEFDIVVQASDRSVFSDGAIFLTYENASEISQNLQVEVQVVDTAWNSAGFGQPIVRDVQLQEFGIGWEWSRTSTDSLIISTPIKTLFHVRMWNLSNNFSPNPELVFEQMEGEIFYYRADVDSFSPYHLQNILNTLPVEWLGLDASYQNGANRLRWTTAQEYQNLGFSVEHRFESQSWEVLDWVEGAGRSNQARDYAFFHLGPIPGRHFYRLRQKNVDGKTSLSSQVAVMVPETSSLVIYPNPGKGIYHIKGQDLDGANARVFQLDGRQVAEKIVAEQKLKLTQLPAGHYILKVQKGQKAYYARITKE